jgi:hypothetical protein
MSKIAGDHGDILTMVFRREQLTCGLSNCHPYHAVRFEKGLRKLYN